MAPYVRTALLLAALTALFLVVGYLIGGQTGMIFALVFAAATNVFAYWNSDKMVLRMYGAQEVTKREAPELVGLVEQLARRADLPMPKVYIIDSDQPNAFATGRNPEHAAVAATHGILRALSSEELAGVLAHELAHVKHRDTLIMTMTATIAGAIGFLATMAQFSLLFGGGDNRNNPLGIVGVLLSIILAPLAATLVQLAISRAREYEADRGGAEICGQPLWLASALQRIQTAAERIPNRRAEAAPATAHLFIINPLSGGHNFAGLFRTHPPTEERVRRLRAMVGAGAQRGAASRPWG